MIKKILYWTFAALVLLIVIYLLGPRVKYPKVDTSPLTFDIPLESLDDFITDQESQVIDLKPGNEAKILWNDTLKQKTAFSIVYLHGFSAGHEEGAPIHIDFAKRYGFNLYLPRIYDHGRKSDDSFKNMLPSQLVNSAREAIAIGKLIGEKVILISCSTGGTFSALLAPEDPAIHSLIMYSPNIDLFDPASEVMLQPWGRQLLKMVMGGEYNRINYNEEGAKYWNSVYHTDGIIALKYLIDQQMNEELFGKIDIPVFLAYYYKDEAHQDKVVSVPRMLDFYNQISTDEIEKRKVAFPNVRGHVFTSRAFSTDFNDVKEVTYKFADEVLMLKDRIIQ